MRFAKSKYPVGATWEYKNEYGKVFRIWFSRMHGHLEVWMWSVQHSDGSGYKCDWRSSYAACKKDIPTTGRFKRIS